MSENVYCCVCGKPATVCKKETINGVTKVSYYCDECFSQLESGYSFDNLISAMFNFGGNSLNPSPMRNKMRVCKCGMTERDILRNGKFGCSDCYNVFRDIVENYVNSRGYVAHKGKSPANFSSAKTNAENITQKTKNNMTPLEKLKAELALAVKEERYLDADRIAKQIEQLKKEDK